MLKNKKNVWPISKPLHLVNDNKATDFTVIHTLLHLWNSSCYNDVTVTDRSRAGILGRLQYLSVPQTILKVVCLSRSTCALQASVCPVVFLVRFHIYNTDDVALLGVCLYFVRFGWIVTDFLVQFGLVLFLLDVFFSIYHRTSWYNSL